MGDTGHLIREVYIQGIENIDWEDLTEDTDGNFYVGGFGSGIQQVTGSYDDLHVYKIKNPLYFCNDTFVPEIINFKYPDDNIASDTEAMFWWEEEIYLIPKIHNADANNIKAGKAYIYKIPAIPNPGSQYVATQLYSININPDYPAEPIDQFKVGGASLSPDGKTLAMIGGNRFWLITDFTPGIFLDGTITAIDFPIGLHWQREAIAFASNTELYIIDENNNQNPNRGKLGKINICNILPSFLACNCSSSIATDAADVFDDIVEEYADGTINRGSSDLEFTYDNASTGQQTIGLRFEDLGIPKGASIEKAYIQFVVDEIDNSQPSNLEIRGHYIGNSPSFSNSNFDVSSRSKSVARRNWSFANWNEIQVSARDQRTADISNIIQEIVNHTDWSNNNALALMISGEGSQTAERYTDCINSAPRLWIEYCSGETSCPRSVSILNQNIDSGNYSASEGILSNGLIPSPNQLIFQTQEILLERQFQVNSGAELQVANEPCTNE